MIRAATDEAIAEAAARLAAGDLVAVPTETVYGIAADAAIDSAVARIFEKKGRPAFNPLIVHVAEAREIEALCLVPALAWRLLEVFAPGPLTLVLPRRIDAKVSWLASAGLETLAVRVPAHPVAAALIRALGRPIVAPSANRSGKVSPTSALHVADDYAGDAPLILDGGPCRLGLESTIIDLTADRPRLLRPGAIARGDIEAVTGPLESPPSGRITAPGMLASHYAPALPLRLNAERPLPGEALLAFGRSVPEGALRTLNLSESGDLREAAARLFALLRALDAPPATAIAVMPVPAHGLGEAINDRLARAAAPRR